MSTLKADTIQSTSGGAATLTKQSAAKAFVSYTSTTSHTIRSSLNTASLTDNGTGDFTQAFTNSFANDDYVTGAVTGEAGSGAAATYMQASSYWTTGSHRWQSWYYQSTKYDDVYAQNTYTGDLA